MLTRAIRKSLQNEEGQALVMACLMMLILSIAVITTVNLGHTIHERVRIQNNADAAAYSMAAMEARAFNFYAFANRTQVSHYVSAMIWQSLDSFLYFLEAFLADVYGFLKTLDVCAHPSGLFWTAACPLIESAPVIGPILKAIDTIIGQFRNLVQLYEQGLKSIDPDALIGKDIIPAHWVLNEAMAGVSTAVMESVLANVVETSSDIVALNDPNIDSKVSQLVTGALSACIFDRAHYREANGSPFAPKNPARALDPAQVLDSSKVALAKRVMGQIANATRYPCDSGNSNSGLAQPAILGCPVGFVTSRKLGDMISLPDWAQPIRSLLDGVDTSVPGLLDMGKLGQTRLLTTHYTDGQSGNRDENFIRDWRDPPGYGIGQLAQADNLASDDLYWFKLGPQGSWLGFNNPLACSNSETDYWKCWGDPHKDESDRGRIDEPYHYMMKTSIWALNSAEGIPGGIHWRIDYGSSCKGSECDIGVTKTSVCTTPLLCFPKISVYAANTRPMQDGNHSWFGTVPFPHFEPGQYAAACPGGGGPSSSTAANHATEFNQPSTWVALNKKPPEMRNPNPDDTGAGSNTPALLNSSGQFTFDFGAGNSQALVLDDTHRAFAGLGFAGGLNAISRAQAYYHRPGNWQEQPNYFNPYWHPRLASVYQGRYSMPLADKLTRLIPGTIAQQIITH